MVYSLVLKTLTDRLLWARPCGEHRGIEQWEAKENQQMLLPSRSFESLPWVTALQEGD